MLAGKLYCDMVAGRVKLYCNRVVEIVLQDNKGLLEVYCNRRYCIVTNSQL